VLTLLATLVLLSVLILVHELGHFIAAKSVDIEVQRFSLGMGPRVAGFRWGETDFVLSALPIGGYVSMSGMQDEEAVSTLEGGGADEREVSPRDFDRKPLWARVWVVSAGVLMNFLFAIFVFALIPFVWGEQVDTTRAVAVRNVEALPAAAAPLAAVPLGAEVVSVNERPVGDWNAMVRALIDAGSGAVTLRFAEHEPVTFRMPTQDSLRAEVLMAIRPHYEPVLSQISRGGAADAAGLQPGDRVISAGGEPMRTWWEFEEAIRASPEQPLPLVIERQNQSLPVTVVPELRPGTRRGEDAIGFLGVGVQRQVEVREFGLADALVRGVEDTWQICVTIVSFLGNLITGQESARQVGSVLTIGQISGEFARAGLQPFLYWMGLFSVNLAVLNLLPIPILDGGHLLFMLIEGIRGRPLSVEQRIRLSHVGLIIVVGIMVWALTNDVLRVFGI
jgi:regulator of sigma E protease